MKEQIAIIEDDLSINQGIVFALGEEEYEFHQFYCLSDAKDITEMNLLILDINLPDGDGLEYLQQLRKVSQIPVLLLTANDTEMDEVMGLQMGADDYITKPFSLMILRLRVQKLLSRKKISQVYENGELYFDFNQLLFRKNGLKLEFSKTELRLLRYLVENEGITMTREKLITYVWQNQEFVEENALSVTIKRLRDKLEDTQNKYIHTIYGIGYTWRWGEGKCLTEKKNIDS